MLELDRLIEKLPDIVGLIGRGIIFVTLLFFCITVWGLIFGIL